MTNPKSNRPPVLRLAGIRKSFGATQALRGVSLEVAAGEVHALMGENGEITMLKKQTAAKPRKKK